MATTVEAATATDGVDLDDVIDVCRRALGWNDDPDSRKIDADFFRWKHVDNPFGPSPLWLARDESDNALVGVRTLMRWELVSPEGDTAEMVRAVDTATLPTHQGQGIFSRLTTAAVDDLTAAGLDAVFNTPNDKSRPGYLKMGWHEVGKIPVGLRPRSPLALAAMARSRVAADKWGQPTTVGAHPAEALADTDRLTTAIAADRASIADSSAAGWHTALSPEYLRWRTGFEQLHCRVELLGSELDDGFIVFRLRRRGALLQLSILDVVDPRRRSLRRPIGHLLTATGADVALATGRLASTRAAMVPVRAIGPVLTWRPLARAMVPDSDALGLSLGTIELF